MFSAFIKTEQVEDDDLLRGRRMGDKKEVHSTGRNPDAHCVRNIQEPEPIPPKSLLKDKVQDEGV